MRQILIPAMLAASIAVGGVAVAATPMVHKTAATQAAPNPKAGDCLKQWKAQKKHTQTRKVFLAACEKA